MSAYFKYKKNDFEALISFFYFLSPMPSRLRKTNEEKKNREEKTEEEKKKRCVEE